MAMRLTNAAASGAAGDGTNAGLRAYIGATPKLKFYTGNVHASAETGPAGTLLATVTIAAFGAATNGAITSVGGNVSVVADGTVGCWALFKSDGTTKVADGSVAETSGGDINFDETAWLTNCTVTMGNLVLTVPPA